MRSPFFITWLCLSVLLLGNASGENDFAVTYEEIVDYVEYPDDAASQALLATQPLDGEIPKLRVGLWTTADDYQHPLWYLVKGIVRRLEKDLVAFEPSYYLLDGEEEGCRVTDPLTQKKVVNTNITSCITNCTNYGRYCAASAPADPAKAIQTWGTRLLEESLRRMCVWVVYGKTNGNNALHFWNYINHYGFTECDDPFSDICTDNIMDQIGISPHFIHRCMNHTKGLDDDTENAYMKEELNKMVDLQLGDLPLLKIGFEYYTGPQTTKDIFKAVCAAYPQDRQPVACDFCKDCDDVRLCLWTLQCNGESGPSFAEYAAAKTGTKITPAPTSVAPTAPVPVASTPLPISNAPTPEAKSASVDDNNNSQSENEQASPSSAKYKADEEAKEKAEAKESMITGVILGLVIGWLISAVYACRDWQAKIVLNEITKEDKDGGSGKGSIQLNTTMMTSGSHDEMEYDGRYSDDPHILHDSSVRPTFVP